MMQESQGLLDGLKLASQGQVTGMLRPMLAKKKLNRFNLQRLRAHQYLSYFLDLHMTGEDERPALQHYSTGAGVQELSVVETQELVLLSCIQKCAGLLNACRQVPAPQMWIGSSVMLCFDAKFKPTRDALKNLEQLLSDISRVHIFDWGRSELNTEQSHKHRKPEEQDLREKYWSFYCGGIARLFFDLCCLYVGRYWHPKKSLVVGLYKTDFISEEVLLGCSIIAAASGRKEHTLRTPDGSTLSVGLLNAQPSTIDVAVHALPLPPQSRFEEVVVVRANRASNVPKSSLGSSHYVATVCGVPDDPAEVTRKLEEMETRCCAFFGMVDQQTTPKTSGCEDVWDEEFEVAALKPNCRAELLSALSLALGRSEETTVAENEIDELLPSFATVSNQRSREELKEEFVRLVFPNMSQGRLCAQPSGLPVKIFSKSNV